MTEGPQLIRSATFRSWRDPRVIALALFALASGFGQFGAISALGDVAKSFGHATHGTSIVDEAGLSGTQLGLGLAVLRLASLAGLPLAALADRIGRRRLIVTCCSLGLFCTVGAAASPSYWWFVVIFALGRPLLSATNAVAQVGAAETTGSHDRAKAIALVAAGYGVGSGLTAVIHGLASGTLGFRGIFALAAVPFACVLLARRSIVEPERFVSSTVSRVQRAPVLGAIGRPFRKRLFVVVGLAFAVSVITGPANSFVFIYSQNVLKLSGVSIAIMVVVAAVFGLAGLSLGRVLADRLGRRPSAALAMVAMALFGVVAYSGSRGGLVIGYELGVLAGAAFAPPAGALVNELFPTSIRSSVAGWNVAAGVLGAVAGLLAFGSIADVGNHFAVGAVATFLPAVGAAALFALLPETNGHELEDLWPES